MKSMKGLSNKMLGSIKKRTDSSGDTASAGSDSAVDLQGDSPEAVGARSVVRQTPPAPGSRPNADAGDFAC